MFRPRKSDTEAMSCKSCKSTHQTNLNGEIGIHFPGLKGLNKPITWVFPTLVACLDCGFTEFTVPEKELGVLVSESSMENPGGSTGEETLESGSSN